MGGIFAISAPSSSRRRGKPYFRRRATADSVSDYPIRPTAADRVFYGAGQRLR
ncbi:hypothetical protein I553_2893 [Mycobacterium xenopi 4042]|uniref:Uncharacterized protein n=1 Tax=Mycobacterium xenopi 4042 TaxID=1299334 RepID=X8EF18_MYCXE|nr:hypothetical protein I553_2893 [Mycobacterium xenopi 4042]